MNDLANAATLQDEPLAGLGPLVLNGAWGREAREYLTRVRSILGEQHRAGATGHAIVEAYTRAIDHMVLTLFSAARAHYQERFAVLDQRCTMVAQGGYGRAELNPCSDIDLLILYPHRRDRYVETVTEKVLYALWDTKLTVGHAARNVRECVRLAAQDLKVKTALLDGRYVAGDANLYAEFATAMERECSAAMPASSSARSCSRIRSATSATVIPSTWSSRT
jgi:[protein-PII] uridylyltransferase